jgi:ribonuclease HI
MSLTIYTDGGARGNPGPAAAGVVIYRGSEKIAEAGQYLGPQTNNWAEYEAVIYALGKVYELGLSREAIEFKLDSLLVVEQLRGNWKIKEPALKQQVLKVQSLMKDVGTVVFAHIPREQNKEADRLVNETLDAHT